MKNSESRLCFLDFETTGVIDYISDPIEIGAVLVDENLEVISSFVSRIKPLSKQAFSEEAYKIHGISYEETLNAPGYHSVLMSFFGELGYEYRFAGWNIGFDTSFFKKMCYYSGNIDLYSKINYRSVDIQTIAYCLKNMGMLPENINSLSDAAKFFGIRRAEKHNALDCAEVALEVYKMCMILLNEGEDACDAQ